MKTDDPILLYPILPCLTFQIYTISINYCTRCISVFPHQMKMGIFFLYQQSPRLSHVPLSVISDTRFKIMEDTQCQYQSQCWVFGGERCPVCPSIKNLTIGQRKLSTFKSKFSPPPSNIIKLKNLPSSLFIIFTLSFLLYNPLLD